MDDQTLARFKASGEKDLATFLAKQGAQSDLPPGVSGYSGGAQTFAGSTSAERSGKPAPTYAERIEGAFSRLSGLPAALRSAGESLGLVSPAAGSQGNVLTAAGRLGQSDPAIDELQKRSNRLATGQGNVLQPAPVLATAQTAQQNADFEKAAAAANTPASAAATPAPAPAAPPNVLAKPAIVTAVDSRVAGQSDFLLPSERASGRTFIGGSYISDEERKRQQNQTERLASSN